MQPLMFLYESFVEFEIGLIAMLINDRPGLATFGLSTEPVTTWGGLSVVPQYSIDDIDSAEHDILIIPGGRYQEFKKAEKLFQFIRKFDKEKKPIAAICGGPAALGYAGILGNVKYTTSLNINEVDCFPRENYLDENIVLEKNIITAKGNCYIEFAREVGKKINLFKDTEEEGIIGYWKGN